LVFYGSINDLFMKKNLLRLTVLLLLGAVALGNLVFAWQASAASAASSFPEKLLEGTPEFNLAILLQSDARGNFGPCG
jgi:hypothetical protein